MNVFFKNSTLICCYFFIMWVHIGMSLAKIERKHWDFLQKSFETLRIFHKRRYFLVLLRWKKKISSKFERKMVKFSSDLLDRRITLTFNTFIRRRPISTPWRITVPAEIPEFQIRDRQTNNARLVQLRRYGSRKREHFRQFVKLEILLPPPRPRSIPALLLPQL